MATTRPRRLVGTSMKMYFDFQQTSTYIEGVAALSADAQTHNVDLFVIPDFVSLVPAEQKLRNTTVKLGAQDVFWENSGAYTGEVSPVTLQQVGVRIVEIGHAERRRLFGETDEHVAKKAAAIASNGMTPLVCVGEKSSSPIASAAVGMAVQEIRPQVLAVSKAVDDAAELVIAYEPVWAIGAKEPANADHVVAVVKQIREMVKDRRGQTRIVYGGSAGPGTFLKLAEAVDGLFLGRFAHDLNNLKKVIEEFGRS